MPAPVANSKLSFGLFEVDLQTGELWKAGFRVKLQSQPFRVLAMLLEKPGHMVGREELQLRLWGKDTVVDFDHSLGTAINKIREALGDSAENPRFIETLSRRGYRFIAPVTVFPGEEEVAADGGKKAAVGDSREASEDVERALEVAVSSDAVPAISVVVPVTAGAVARRRYGVWALGVLALLAAVAAGFFVGSSRSVTTPPHIV